MCASYIKTNQLHNTIINFDESNEIKDKELYSILGELINIYSKRDISSKIYYSGTSSKITQLITNLYSSYMTYEEMDELINNKKKELGKNDDAIIIILYNDLIEKLIIEIENYIDKYVDIKIDINGDIKWNIPNNYDPLKYIKSKLNHKFITKKTPKKYRDMV